MTEILKLDYEKVKTSAAILSNLYSNGGDNQAIGTQVERLKNSNIGKTYAEAGFVNLQELSFGTALYAAKIGNKFSSEGNALLKAANAIKDMDETAARNAFKSAYRIDKIDLPSDVEVWLKTGSTFYSAYNTLDFSKDAIEVIHTAKNLKSAKGVFSAIKAAAEPSPVGAVFDAIFLGIDTYNGIQNQGDIDEEFKNTGDVAEYVGEEVTNWGPAVVDGAGLLGAALFFTPAAPVGAALFVTSGIINAVNFGVEITGVFGKNEQGENKDLFEATGDAVTGALDWVSNTFHWGW